VYRKRRGDSEITRKNAKTISIQRRRGTACISITTHENKNNYINNGNESIMLVTPIHAGVIVLNQRF